MYKTKASCKGKKVSAAKKFDKCPFNLGVTESLEGGVGVTKSQQM